MSEQQAEQTGAEAGSHGAGPAVPPSADAAIEQASAQGARNVESPDIVPDQEASMREATVQEAAMQGTAMNGSGPDAPKAEMPKAEPFKVQGVEAQGVEAQGAAGDARKDDAPKASATGIGPLKAEPTRGLLIMSPREGSWTRAETGFESRTAEPKAEPDRAEAGTGGRRFAAMAAMLLLAVIAGAAGGAFATAGMSHLTETAKAAAPSTTALEASVARIDADIVALKAGLEQTTKAGQTQFNKTSDRLERIEKAQNEPNAKLARLSEAVDKLRAAAAPAATPVASAAPAREGARDVTGTVTAPAGAQALPVPPAAATLANAGAAPRVEPAKPEIGRLPTVEGWVLRDAGRGSALIEGRTGLYEVFAGDPIPGIGRVEAIRKQDGRWVVVTPKGLIVAR